MGRHTAVDGSSVHPPVPGGPARRPAGPAAAEGPAEPLPDGSGLGWPAPRHPGGGGLGWPGDLERAGLRGYRTVTAVVVTDSSCAVPATTTR